MTIIICAAGNSRRMGELTSNVPKPLLSIGDNAIIENLVESLTIDSVEEIIIIVGYLGNQIMDKLGDAHNKIKISYVSNEDYENTNNMYSILLAKDKIESGMVFVSADVILTSSTCRSFLKDEQKNLILIDDNPIYYCCDDPVKVSIKNGSISGIDKIMQRDIINGVAVGLYKFSFPLCQEYFEIAASLIKKGHLDYGYIEPVKILIDQYDIRPFYIKNEPWFDIDTPKEYIDAGLFYNKAVNNNKS